MSRALIKSVVFFLSLSAPLAYSQDSAEIVAQAEKSLLKIEIEDVGQGSGFVVDSSGIAITNVHVMAAAQNGKAIATFPDGKVCEITGSYLIDKARDIAVIQLKLNSLPTLAIAASQPRKGDEVLALGSPMGLSFTATRGIVSAIRSEEEMRRELDDPSISGTWIQVDAPLSPGNSGGPLINKNGELVAMSTRASFGQAQNLNFGISGADIRNAIDLAKGKPLISLMDGLGRIDMEEEKPESGEIVDRKKIPPAVIREYVDRGRQNFALLVKGLRRELGIQKEICRIMKLGRVQLELGEKIAREPTSGRYFYGSEGLKNITVTRQEVRVSELETMLRTIGKTPTNESLLALLWNFGPTVDLRDKGSVGFLSNAYVMRAITERDVIIDYYGGKYLLWVKDASGLSDGEPMTPVPVFVVGSKTLALETGESFAVTILYSLVESELRQAIFGSEDSAVATQSPQSPVSEQQSTLRKWRDKTGKFEIEATLVNQDATKVVLKKADGSVITVPVDKLCESDRKFLQTK